YWNGSNIKLLLENPNVIKVDVEDLEDIVVNADGFPKNTNWTPEFLESLGYNAKPEVTTQNTLLNPTTTYADKDTIWYSDSTGYSFNRFFKSSIYSGGYTKWDTTSHKISLDNLVSVEGDKNSHLEDFEISQNYPNPFNPSTTIEFSVPVKANVNISIYNTLGELVTNLHSGTMEAGYHQIKFDASRFTSGTYIYRINVNDGKLFSDSKKMLLIK
ncbi:MAG: T9SS type A sorting domain-containing protein, partial [Ignavibacteria bacterium]|nr:T9SS type A sorting domain-containing protein [Ignavibacteria bacterium]